MLHRLKKNTYSSRVVFYIVYVSLFMGIGTLTMQNVHAATDSFTVQTLVGEDVNPPTTPGSFTATPIATSQIDLSWATSTDNFVLSGYHVWRNGVRIATTTSVAYTDTGLTASTTYSYYVTAFDSFFNESASSTVVSTSTLSDAVVEVVSEAETNVYGSQAALETYLESLEIFPQRDRAIVRFATDEYIKAVVKWGRTSSYELGSLVENAYTKNHETLIAGLQPNTKYYVRIEGESRSGVYGVIYAGVFKTLMLEDVFPPENIREFDAREKDGGVLLSWRNPYDEDFVKVRIVRSDTFYPSDVADGMVVYEGDSESFLDMKGSAADVLYYTAFSYDTDGNISSGSALRFVKKLKGDELTPLDPEKNSIGLTHDDIAIIQDGERIPWDNKTIQIDGTKQFTVTIPYESLPEHLKTIYVILRTAESGVVKTFSFLLRVNAERTVYTSTVAPLGVLGDFPIQISVFDFKTMQVGYIEGVIESRIISEYEDYVHERDYSFIGSIIKDVPPLITFVALGIFFLLIRFRRIFI